MKIQYLGLIIFAICSLLIYSCTNKNEKGTQKRSITNQEKLQLKDSCNYQMNDELVQLLSKPVELKMYLDLNDSDIEIIQAKSSKKISKNLKEALLNKISNKINDNAIIPIQCAFYDEIKVKVGDLALICLYSIEKYPFAAALGCDWCTGKSISKEMHLPYDLIFFQSKGFMQKNYKSYLKGEIRKKELENGHNKRN